MCLLVIIIDQPRTHQTHFFFKLAVRPRGPPGLRNEYLKERVQFKGILVRLGGAKDLVNENDVQE